MPGVENGFKTAIADIFSGFIVSAVLSALSGELGSLFLLFFSLMSIVGLMETFDKMEHWSLLYLIGWLGGIALVGPFLLERWEVQLSLIVGAAYFALKFWRKM